MNGIKKRNNTTYALEAPEMEVEIGDALQSEFYPQVKFKKWNNEANFSLRYIDPDPALSKSLPTKAGEVVKWRRGNKEAHFYPLEPTTTMIGPTSTPQERFAEGGFEFEIVFDEKPVSNRVEFSIQSKELDFFYQPFLTDEERYDLEIHRPEDVEGSYAVYHKTKKDNQYKTGKAFHIYRPKAKDAAGQEIWCELHIDEQASKLTVTVPQMFLDSAVYPVIVDPTFGYTVAGGSTLAVAGTTIYGSVFSAPENGTFNSLSVYAKGATGTNGPLLHWAVYNHSDSTLIEDDSLIASLLASPSWHTYNASGSINFTASTEYVLTIGQPQVTKGGNNMSLYFDAGTTNQGHSATMPNLDTVPNPASFTHNNNKYSIYATYTAGGGTEVNDERDAKLTGNDNTNSERDSKITGQDTASTERSAKITGQDTENDSRPAITHGLQSATDERSATLDGTDTASSEREANLAGFDEATSERDSVLIGQNTANSERDGKLTGKDTANSERSSTLIGFNTDNSQRDSKLTGSQTDNSERDSALLGEQDTSSERGVGVVGDGGANDTRGAKLSGTDTANSERSSRITGTDSDSDSRPAKITGQEHTSSEVPAKITGQSRTSDNRSARIVGQAHAEDTRPAKIIGTIDTSDSREATITGQEHITDDRQAKVIGKDTDSSERDSKITGQAFASDEIGAKIPGKTADSSDRGAYIRGKEREVRQIIVTIRNLQPTITFRSLQPTISIEKIDRTQMAIEKQKTTVSIRKLGTVVSISKKR